VVLTLVGAVLMYAYPWIFTGALLMVPLLLSEVVLSPRRAPTFVAFLVAVLAVETLLEYPDGIPARRWVTALIVLVMAFVVLVTQVRRARLGVRGLTGDSMLLDLKERINRNGEIPELPIGWGIDVATRSAGDTSFAGDFMVAHREGHELTLVLVDVSGKGVDAGTRSLLLSGAFGGLLGAVSPDRFFPAANEFLNRQAWDEGFATAIQLFIDLRTGAYEIRVAGHPPAIQFRAGSGLWHVHDEVHGPILGVTTAPEFPPMTGRLGLGDALMLYTDGLVERPTRDIWRGIDKLIGEGERYVRHRFEGAARDLVRSLGASDDDCALIILQRQ
jgi:serine phosphatase RsbU (regulator of sigma subunit)